MKVGLSYSRCMRDLFLGKVRMNDVLIIIARTHFDPNNDEQWEAIWNGYSRSEWSILSGVEGAKETMRGLSLDLYESGRLHQPRKYGAMPHSRSHYWLETVLVDEELETNPSAKAAWDHFQLVAGLTGVELDEEYG